MAAIVLSLPSMSSISLKDQHGGRLNSRQHAVPVQDLHTTPVDGEPLFRVGPTKTYSATNGSFLGRLR
jgi:hypothetical protein